MLDAALASAMELSVGQKWIGATWFYIAVIHTVLRQKINGIGHFVANWKVCLINFTKYSGKKISRCEIVPIFASETTKTGSPVGQKKE
jgi:hypothetical protein